MRRMLDPKEVGGGGAANKLYKHTIKFWSSSYGTIYLTIYNTTSDTIDSGQKVAAEISRNGDVVASGFIKNKPMVFMVYYVRMSGDKAEAVGYRYDSEGNVTTYAIYLDYNFSTIDDDVKQVR